MVIALLSIELHLPGAATLKDKRQVLRRLKDRLKKYNVAVAEVEYQDLWQRAGLGIVTVGTSRQHVEETLTSVSDEIDRVEPGLMTRSDLEFLA